MIPSLYVVSYSADPKWAEPLWSKLIDSPFSSAYKEYILSLHKVFEANIGIESALTLYFAKIELESCLHWNCDNVLLV